ncbi:MAG: type transport system permease protein, partial [Actinomycetota bacterium]|nr:type transport system permease protein [Actinomycetota bacterium]
MGSAIKAEFRKFFTTRMWWGMAIGVLVAGAVFAAAFAFLAGSAGRGGGPRNSPLPTLDDPQMVASVYTGGLTVAYLLTLVVGVMSIGSEYRHKTITSTFLSTPKRVRVMAAKVTSLLGIGAFYGLVFLVGSVGVGSVIIALKGFSPLPDAGPIVRTLALSLLALGLWSLIGLGAGILIPNQIAAILIAVGAAWIVEPIAGVLLGLVSWGRPIVPFLPSAAPTAMVGEIRGDTSVVQLCGWAGALMLL